MNNQQPLLSIVIPTRNRLEYALACSEQVLNSTNESVEVVIQDNSDDNSLLDKLKKSPYFHRIRYNYSPGVISFVDNFSHGVANATGEYICMIGDDDGINPEIVEAVEWAKKNKVEAIVPAIRLSYIWPDTGIVRYETDNGNLMIVDFTSNAKVYNPKLEVKKLLASGGQNYLTYNMVKVYHGIVTKSALDKVKSITSRYFGGVSPDIYSSVALSLLIDKVITIDYPLTIPGVCKTSGAGHAATGKHIGKLEDAPQLKGHINYQWSEFVPRFYSVETVWAETVLACLKQMKRPDLEAEFNVCALAAYCGQHREYASINKENLDRYFKSKNIGILKQWNMKRSAYLNGPITNFAKRVVNRLTRKKNMVQKYSDVTDIEAAEMILKEYLTNKNVNFSTIIPTLNKLL